MTRHTPGPWSVQPGYYPGFLEIKGASFKISLVTSATDLDFKDYCSRTADAHLIAAAPCMLAALQYALPSLGHEERRIVEEAIAKATGVAP